MNIQRIVDQVALNRIAAGAQLFAISGIDASGKSTISEQIAKELEARRIRTALINIDAWHNPPEIRFDSKNPGEHFYNFAFRFNELFDSLILPLKKNRSIQLTTRLTRLPQNDAFTYDYNFQDIDIIVLEGIFLMKRELRKIYDSTLWLDCSFEKALKRAIDRNQEGLSEREIVRDYNTIYFPAQRFHFLNDAPREAATWVMTI